VLNSGEAVPHIPDPGNKIAHSTLLESGVADELTEAPVRKVLPGTVFGRYRLQPTVCPNRSSFAATGRGPLLGCDRVKLDFLEVGFQQTLIDKERPLLAIPVVKTGSLAVPAFNQNWKLVSKCDRKTVPTTNRTIALPLIASVFGSTTIVCYYG
jgi:hypothetical protein